MIMTESTDKKYEKIFFHEDEELKSYLDIWEKNPSFKAINLKGSIIKILFSTVFYQKNGQLKQATMKSQKKSKRKSLI